MSDEITKVDITELLTDLADAAVRLPKLLDSIDDRLSSFYILVMLGVAWAQYPVYGFWQTAGNSLIWPAWMACKVARLLMR